MVAIVAIFPIFCCCCCLIWNCWRSWLQWWFDDDYMGAVDLIWLLQRRRCRPNQPCARRVISSLWAWSWPPSSTKGDRSFKPITAIPTTPSKWKWQVHHRLIIPRCHTSDPKSIHNQYDSYSEISLGGRGEGVIRNKKEYLIDSYFDYWEQLNDQLRNVLPAVHVGFQEALVRLLSRDSRKRPTAQLLSSIKYFR